MRTSAGFRAHARVYGPALPRGPEAAQLRRATELVSGRVREWGPGLALSFVGGLRFLPSLGGVGA